MVILEERKTHAFEAGFRGKPDELETQFAQLLGAHILERGQALGIKPRFDLHIGGGYNPSAKKFTITVGGEISKQLLEQNLTEEFSEIMINHYNTLHHSSFDPDQFLITYSINKQNSNLAKNIKSGDAGHAIGVAVANSPLYLPWERWLTLELRNRTETSDLEGVLADGKIQVKSYYYEGVHERVDKITVAAQHDKSLDLGTLNTYLTGLINDLFLESQEAYDVDLGNPRIYVNTAGPFHNGGWKTDAGSNEAKPYRDGFSTHGCNEDSFSGEDPTKVSGTGSYLARYIANQIIHNGLAEYAKVSLDYTIGTNEVTVDVDTEWTGKLQQEEVKSWVRENFPLTIPEAIEKFDLWNPEVYQKTAAASDFFHSPEFAWNKVDH